MDDTQQSRASDAATRKRRSSILKSQRPPRTPFCELEFNVTTPPDTTKSRRVSFSRRTGVAEFVTNEATTTWKNFYEEHNKSLESSGNDSGANGTKQTVGHLGKRLFDEQFEEVEVIDFKSLGPSHGINVSTSINNVNFTLDCTDKLPAPQNNFELSAFTEQRSKVFGDDHLIPCMGEVSDRIDINFSAIQKIGEKDDLDEIQQDLQRQSNAACHGPFEDRRMMSEYIEVDLDMTHVAIRQDESDDMSITDMIQAPKVQDVSKNSTDKKVNLDKDWVTDKENIAINPYVAPRESLNFAINEEPDKVLVFDGKKLIVQSEKPIPDKIPQRKTIVLNCDDDLPNFVDNSKNVSGFSDIKLNNIKGDNALSDQNKSQNKQTTILYDDDSCNISITKAAFPNELSLRRRTVLYDNDSANISVTQAVPLNIIDNPNKTRTVVYESDDGNISVTKAITGVFNENKVEDKTVPYENEAGDISVTQAIPNIIPENPPEKRKTIIFEDNAGNVSMTQAIPNIVIKDNAADKRRTIVYEKDTGNISVTQVISTNVILIENNAPDRRRTVVFENDTGNISITQAVPTNILAQPVIETPMASDVNISMTQPVPTNILLGENSETTKVDKSRSVVYNNETGDISITQCVPANKIHTILTQNESILNKDKVLQNNQIDKRRTVVFDNEDAEISVTQAVNLNQLLPGLNIQDNMSNKKSILDGIESNCTEAGNNNMTEAVPNPIDTNQDNLANNKRRTIVFENDDADISMTQAVNVNKLLSAMSKTQEELVDVKVPENVMKNRRGTIMYEKDDADISMTQAISANILPAHENRQSIMFDDCNISMKQAIPSHIIAENKSLFMEIDNITNDSQQKILDVSMTDLKDENIHKNIEMVLEHEKSRKNTNEDTTNNILNETKNVSKSGLNKSFGNKNDTLKSLNEILVYQAVALSGQNETKDECKSQDTNDESATDNNDVEMSSANVECDLESKTSHTIPKSHDISMDSIQRNEALSTGSYPLTIAKFSNTSAGELNNSILENFSEKQQELVMKELLDLNSTTALENNVDVKEATSSTKTPSEPGSCKSQTTSNDSLFYITNDKSIHQLSEKLPSQQIVAHSSEVNENINKKLSEIKTALSEQTSNKDFEQISSPNNKKPVSTVIMDKIKKGVQHYRRKKSFKSANDTDELLGMLSDFTDIPNSKTIDENAAQEEQGDILPQKEETIPLEEDEKPLKDEDKKLLKEELDKPLEESKPITLENRLAIEDKSEESEPEPKTNIVPRRMSVALSREELLHNLSMATAALQKSRMELDDSENIVDTSRETPDEEISPKKTVRMSSDVVKTLKFEEESTSDVIITDTRLASLKKTAFGEISYMKEAKNKVIPDYITDTSLGVKELMDDLVKPMADILPYDTIGNDKNMRRVPSTCSTQIQANLITSSQVDLTSAGLCSNCDSLNELGKMSSAHIISEAVQRSLVRALKSPISTRFDTTPSYKSFDTDTISEDIKPDRTLSARPCGVEQQGHVLIFDQNNPLNNILLAPMGPVEVHKYNPTTSGESINLLTHSNSGQDETVTQYCLSDSMKMHNYSESGMSSTSKAQSIDRATEVKNEIVHAEVNTVIAMKGNKELLEASSSLTLVDDALAPSEYDVHMEKVSPVKKVDITDPLSPVRVIYKVLENAPEKLDSDLTSNDELAHESLVRAKKRMYSPAQRDNHKHMFSKSELTPKPISKMQKISSTPEYKAEYPSRLPAEKDEPEIRSPDKLKYKKPGATITVQQLLTEYNLRDIDHESLKTRIKEALDYSDGSSVEVMSSPNKLEVVGVSVVRLSSSCSSKNMREDSSVAQVSDKSSRMETEDEDCDKKKAVTESDSGVNVVAKIDMLPFMGSPECEWESSSGDTWSFRLLHARLRLVVRLSHRHDNAARSIVRADTPVVHLALETIREEKKNPLAALCVSLAADTMRWAMSTGCSTAGEVPSLVRRVAAAARAAVRWTRAMHAARLRLAYTLTEAGLLSLKVANLPLRSVWEVTLRIELCTDEPGVGPYPRARDVRVTRVLADTAVCGSEVARVLARTPRDWGHVPRTVWKMFKYLKHKTHDDNHIFNV